MSFAIVDLQTKSIILVDVSIMRCMTKTLSIGKTPAKIIRMIKGNINMKNLLFDIVDLPSTFSVAISNVNGSRQTGRRCDNLEIVAQSIGPTLKHVQVWIDFR